MKDFNLEGVESINPLKHKVKVLFESRGRPGLIIGFNAFLPLRHRIMINLHIQYQVKNNMKLPRVVFPQKQKQNQKQKRRDDDDDVHVAEINLPKVIDYVNKVYEIFHNNEEGEDVFKQFLEIVLSTNHPKRIKLSHYESINASKREELRVFNEVKKLFKGHPDLIKEPMEFLTCTTSNCFPSTRTTRKNKSEDPEEKMCEVHREMSIVKRTSKSVSALLEKIEMENGPSIIYVEDHLTELELKCVYKCYEDQELKVMNRVRKDIRRALRWLIEYSKVKEEELKQRRDREKIEFA